MIERATAIEVVRPAKSGRTAPMIMFCETHSGEIVETFCKFSAACEQGVVHLAREVVSVCLAADLGLPVPKPYLVEVPAEFAFTISDPEVRARIVQSSPIAFGSTRIPNQFSVWSSGNKISDALLPIAAAAFVFDGIIQNPDRRVGNPNCEVKGDEIRLFDHDWAFSQTMVLPMLWRAPWQPGGFASLADPAHRHIFLEGLARRTIDFEPIKAAWTALSDERLQEYEEAIPLEWAAARTDVNAAVRLIADARDNFDACIAEVRRILS